LPARPGRDPPAAADKLTRTLAPFPPPDGDNGSALRAAVAVADSRLLARRRSGYGGGRSRAVPARPSAETSHWERWREPGPPPDISRDVTSLQLFVRKSTYFWGYIIHYTFYSKSCSNQAVHHSRLVNSFPWKITLLGAKTERKNQWKIYKFLFNVRYS
jgi:hypothetical protein